MLKKLLIPLLTASLLAPVAGCVVHETRPRGVNTPPETRGPRNRMRCGKYSHWDPRIRACVQNGSRGRVITSS